ncbi:hypothetical protein L6452_20820 [Arctium lappa]|uniref:Uncharacterized protein n=1 Tax=Arctium lappa TaxID=4217 RepID=A0ACB9BBZ9_ARCLA|nr:hypothetical protein L6452_20820 [Arctium lappa]
MAPETVCELPKASLTDDFEDLLENMELDEGLLRELLEEVNDEPNMDQISMVETVGYDVPPTKEKNDDTFHFLSDQKSQQLFDPDKQIQDFDYWISQQTIEMACPFPGLPFENEMMPFWHVENRIEEAEMMDDIANYVELWEGWKS